MKNFNLQCFLDAANELMRADDTLRALHLLNNLPGYYRDNIPTEVLKLKREIYSKVATSDFYAHAPGNEHTLLDPKLATEMLYSLRGMICVEDVKLCNKNGFIPTVLDVGPGTFWLPSLLESQDLKFKYAACYLNERSFNAFKHRFEKFLITQEQIDESQPKIMVATEIIEHLHNEYDIRFDMERFYGSADIISVSTPRYTYDTNCLNWKDKGDIGHLRTYTPGEFFKLMCEIFPEYTPYFYNAENLQARMVKRDTKFDCIKWTMGKDILKDVLQSYQEHFEKVRT